jgi:hypothetical protein
MAKSVRQASFYLQVESQTMKFERQAAGPSDSPSTTQADTVGHEGNGKEGKISSKPTTKMMQRNTGQRLPSRTRHLTKREFNEEKGWAGAGRPRTSVARSDG